MINDLIFKKPEEEGIDSQHIINFIDDVRNMNENFHSFLIARHGNIVAEGYCKPFDENFMHRLYSSSKTIVSLAIGKLIGEGIIKLEDKIMDILPEYANEEAHKWLKETTVEDALKMSVPMLTDTYYTRDYKEWAWTFFNHPTRSKALKPAGSIFNYNTSGTFILDVIVEKKTGKTFVEYLRPEFDKIGVSKDIWCVKSPDGFAWGGSGVCCTLRDFAKIAELLLNKGEYKGEQLLPRWYMERATSKQISNFVGLHFSNLLSYGYGYQIWVHKHGYAMLGMGLQVAFIFPEKDLFIVLQGDTQGSGGADDKIYSSFVREVYDKIEDKPLESDNSAKLKEKIDKLELQTGFGEKHSEKEKFVNGKRYVLEENPMGWKWFKFTFGKDEGKLVYENERGEKTITFGLDKYVEGTFPETHYYGEQVDVPQNREQRTLTYACWIDDNTILVRNFIADTSLGICFMRFGFKGNEVGVAMNKVAEFFMNEYIGFAGGKTED